jgi:6-hydroxycyclohex-1-ene-1-carbonyl-CoA dehydrogenase
MTEARTNRFSWRLVEAGKPLERLEEAAGRPQPGEVVVEIAGCGVCHTDVGFFAGGVATNAGLPIVLGHEISGTVVEAGDGAGDWMGRDVLVMAVIPCGDCDMCAAGEGNLCPSRMSPGNDLDGGFASHIVVPATGVAAIDSLPDGYELADFAVVADAVTTPLQAVRRADVGPGDFVVVVGVGGIGGYALQIAAAAGATAVAIDIDDAKLAPLLEFGAAATVNSRGLNPREVRDQVREHAKTLGMPRTGWKIFETSGTAPGQETAFGLLGQSGTLAVVGFTMDKITIRLSNLMAFNATVFGTWGCPPDRYPEAIELVTSGQIEVLPFSRKVPMAEVATVLEEAHAGSDPRRTILIP